MKPEKASRVLHQIMERAPVIPVITIDDVSQARPLAEALVAGGLPVLEVTLRTPVAIDAMKEMLAVKGAVVGAGTLVDAWDARSAKRAGAVFGVSPGVTEEVLGACEEAKLPLLAGTATASEVMRLLARGYTVAKFFPAEINGGVKALKALGAPLSQMRFCPTGGITASNARDYLALPNVTCVGGSWVVPTGLIAAGKWDEIEALARDASGLGA